MFVEGAVEEVPGAWIDAVAEGGRLCVVVQTGPMGKAQIITRSGETVSARTVFDAAPPALPGFAPVESFAF